MERSGWLLGAGIGAGLMYVLDPRQGRRRRALARDKVVSAFARADDAIGATARDMANRARGLVAETRGWRGGGETPDDRVVAERVRAELGHYTSHPGAIDVSATEGRVRLRGAILASEVDAAVRAVRSLRGVRDVDNQLEVHDRPDDVPALRGGVGRRGRRPELLQERWFPAIRVVAGATGLALVAQAGARRTVGSGLLGLIGLGVAARALSNLELKRLLGTGGGRRAIDVHKTLNIAAPVEKVFEFWRRYENFPRFMSNVREVRDIGGGRSHWKIAGPAGVPVEWDAEITQIVPNKVLAWKTVPGTTVEHAGIVRFQENDDGTTNVNIRMSYNPPVGAIGHTVALLFGADPKSELDADLVRMKTLIETGRLPGDAARPDRGSESYVH